MNGRHWRPAVVVDYNAAAKQPLCCAEREERVAGAGGAQRKFGGLFLSWISSVDGMQTSRPRWISRAEATPQTFERRIKRDWLGRGADRRAGQRREGEGAEAGPGRRAPPRHRGRRGHEDHPRRSASPPPVPKTYSKSAY